MSPFDMLQPNAYNCRVCRDTGVIAVDADDVVACQSCDPRDRIIRNRAAIKARIEAVTGQPLVWTPRP